MSTVYRSIDDYYSQRKKNGNEQKITSGHSAEGTNRTYVAMEMQRLLDNGFELSPASTQAYFETMFAEFSATYENSDEAFWDTGWSSNNEAGKMGSDEFACLAIAMNDLSMLRDTGRIDMDTYGAYMSRLFDPATIQGLMDSQNGAEASFGFLQLAGELNDARSLPENQYDNSAALPYGARDIVNSTFDYAYNHEDRAARANNGEYYSTRTDIMMSQQNMDDISSVVMGWVNGGLVPSDVDTTELLKFVNVNLYEAGTGGYMSGSYNGTDYSCAPAGVAALMYALQDIDAIQDPNVKAAMIAGIANPEAMMNIVSNDPEGTQFLSDLDLAVQNPRLFADGFNYDVGNEPIDPATPDPAPTAPPTRGGHADNGAFYGTGEEWEGYGRREDGYDIDLILQPDDLMILSQKAPSERFADLQAAALEYYGNPTQDPSCMFQDRFSAEEIAQITDMAAHGRRSIENMTADTWAQTYYPGRSLTGLDHDFAVRQGEAAARVMTHENVSDFAIQVNHQFLATSEGHPINTPDGGLLSTTDAEALYHQAAALVAKYYGEREQDHENEFSSSLGRLGAGTLGEAIVNAEIATGQDINGNGGVDETYKEEDYQQGGQYDPDFGFGD